MWRVSGRSLAMGLLLALSAAVSSSQADNSIALTFHPRVPATIRDELSSGKLRLEWPVTFGVPFPQKALTDAAQLKLESAEGKEVTVQVRVTGKWRDGSIRWVLVDCILPLPAEPQRYRLIWGEGVSRARATGKRVAVQEDPQLLKIDTGPIHVQLPRKNLAVFRSILVRNRAGKEISLFPKTRTSDVRLENQDGKLFLGSLDKDPEVVVEERGPVRVSVKLEGWTRAVDGEKLGRHVIRVQAFAGQRWLRLYHTFINTADDKEVQYRNIALRFPFEGNAFRFLGVGQKAPQSCSDSDYLLQFRHNKYEVVSGGKAASTGERSPGRVTVSEGATAYTLATRHFRQNFPKEIEIRSGLVDLHFWPRHGKEPAHLGKNMTAKNIGFLWWVHEGKMLDFRLPKEVYNFSYTNRSYDNIRQSRDANAFGIAKTHEHCLDFHGTIAEGGARPATVGAVFEANPMMVVDPRWLCDSGVFWDIAPRSKDFADLEEAHEKTLMFLPAMMERMGDYGIWNFGSYHQTYLPTLDAAQIHRHWPGFHHGGPRWPWLTFVRTGEPRFFDFAEAHSRQLMDTCVCNWEDPAYNKKYWKDEGWWAHNMSLKYKGGLCRYKGLVHWYAGMRMFYNSQVDFALWHYYLTGYQRGWDVAMMMGEFLLRARDDINSPESGRVYGKRGGTGRGAMAMALYRATHDKRYLDLAREQMDFFIAEAKKDPENGYRQIYYAPFVHRYWEVTRDPKVKEWITTWARQRMAENRIWTGRDPFYNLMALGYQFTGDVSFLKHGLAQARVVMENRATGVDPVLEGVIPNYFSGSVGYLAQQWGRFVKALEHHAQKGGEALRMPDLPTDIPAKFQLWMLRPDRVGKEQPLPKFVFHVRKEAGKEIRIPLNFTLYGDDVMLMTMTGPKGWTGATRELKHEKKKLNVEVAFGEAEPAGDYRIEFRPKEKPAVLITRWPLKGNYGKIVIEFPFWMRGAARFYFMPVRKGTAEGSIRFQTRIRPKYYQTHRIYDADGTLRLNKTEQGRVHGRYDLKMPIPPKDQGKLWLYSNGSLSRSDGVILSGDVLPVAAFKREQFFIPECYRSLVEGGRRPE